jgi:Tol biopolymer transport system component
MMKIITLMLASAIFSSSFAGNGPIGIFEDHSDVGNPKHAGSVLYDDISQTYTLKGSGYNIWFGRDEFHYAYRKIKGDFILTANFAFVGKGVDPHRKIGWMVRESLEENASHYSAVLHGDGLTVMQWRPIKGAFMRDPQDEIFAPKAAYQILQLERKGNSITLKAAMPGEPLQLIGSAIMTDMPEEVLAGLFINSHNADVVEEARVWNVRIDRPVAEGYNPDKDGWIGCRMEILDVFTGMRKVIHESKGRFEAPNWMPDGRYLLFNENGSLYTIPVEGGNPVKLNTGSADRLNNDHGISFDGKQLAISHHRQGLQGGGSSVYVLPLTGGEPKLITERTPSYFHGWTGDNKYVLYVAQRDTPIYNVYKSPAAGGKEIQLTFFKNGHVDGPEGSPDNKYIYYNGSQSGTMQLWRMKPDGSAKEQLTFDEYNNWFPHISPDGKWILFISFPADIDPDAHPSYKRVMLRLMPVNGGSPKVVAYLYGGQGTINVPSWSPDSKRVAFVSNSEKQ